MGGRRMSYLRRIPGVISELELFFAGVSLPGSVPRR